MTTAQTPLATVTRAKPTAIEVKPGQCTIGVFPGDKPGEEVTALVKMTKDGMVRAIRTRVVLSEAKGHIWFLGGMVNGRWDPQAKAAITAVGYDFMNLFAGVSFIQPDTAVGEDGKATCNPYFHRGEGGEVDYIKVRMIGIGRNPVGNWVAHDVTLNYNLRGYFVQDLMSKWSGKKKDDVLKSWGTLYPTGAITPEITKGGKMAVACPGGVSLVVDLSNREVVAVIQEHLNRQKFGERNALTICRRNILKRFLAAVQLDGTNAVNIVSWQQPDRDFRRVGEIASAAADGRFDLGDGETVEVQRETVEVVDGDPEAAEALAGDVDEDTGEPIREQDGPEETAATPPDDKKALADARARIRDLVSGLSPAALATKLKAVGFAAYGEVASCNDLRRLQLLENVCGQTDQSAPGPTPVTVADAVAEIQRVAAVIFPSAPTDRDWLICTMCKVEKVAQVPAIDLTQAAESAFIAQSLSALPKTERPKNRDGWSTLIEEARSQFIPF